MGQLFAGAVLAVAGIAAFIEVHGLAARRRPSPRLSRPGVTPIQGYVATEARTWRTTNGGAGAQGAPRDAASRDRWRRESVAHRRGVALGVPHLLGLFVALVLLYFVGEVGRAA